MITIQILTKNNEKTISTAIQSALLPDTKLIVADLGSEDSTVKICKQLGVNPLRFEKENRSEIRNELTKEGVNFYLEPWEIIINKDELFKVNKPSYVKIIKDKIVTKELRFWTNQKFVNPVFERISFNTDEESNLNLYSLEDPSYHGYEKSILNWIDEKPLDTDPIYYQCCLQLKNRQYDIFLKTAEYYLSICKTQTMSVIMTRYYYAMVQLMHNRLVRPSLQNLNLCLCEKPLMAEFWCLMADVYSQLLNNFDLAKEFYENAIILGQKRLKTEKYPMEIEKYEKYPTLMIEECNKMLKASKFNKYLQDDSQPQ